MAQRATAEQKRFLVSYMERHPAFCQREFSSPQGAVLIRQTWERLANMLNEVEDGANKSTDQWMRYWTDQKKTVKARAAQVYRALGRGTGGGPALDVHLSSYELRVLTCMGGWVRISGFADIVDPLEVDPMEFNPRQRYAQPQPTNQRFNPPAHRLALAQRQFAEAQQRLAQAQEQLDQAQTPQRPQPLQRPQPPQPPQAFKRMRTDVQVEEPQEPHVQVEEPQEPHEPTVDMNWVLDEEASPSTYTDLGSATSDFWSVVQSSPSAGQTETVKTTFPALSSVPTAVSTAPFQQYQHSLSVMQPSQVPASSGKFISLQPNTSAGPVRTSDLAASSIKTTSMKSTVQPVKPPTVQQYQRSLSVLQPSQAQVPASKGTSASLPTGKLIAVQRSTSAGRQNVKTAGPASTSLNRAVTVQQVQPSAVNFQCTLDAKQPSLVASSRTPASASTVKLITILPHTSAGQPANRSVPTAPPVRSSNTVQLAQPPSVLISGGKKLKSPPVATSTTPIKDGLQYIVLRSPLSELSFNKKN